MATTIPSPPTFLLETGLYEEFDIDESSYKDVVRIEFFPGPLDAYSLQCQKETVFQSPNEIPMGTEGQYAIQQDLETFVNSDSAALPTEEFEHWQFNNTRRGMSIISIKKYAERNRVRSINFQCSRDGSHTMIFFIRILDMKFMKIGQHPSLADLQAVKIGKYRKILGKDDYVEFNRAVGLNAHGVGIGAFVYLRRIFERLIEGAHIEAAKNPAWDETIYQKGRMDDRISLLRAQLPAFLVDNRSMYSILSAGIHSLSETDCLAFFEPLKTGIELILDEKIEKEQRREKERLASKAIQDMSGKLKNT